MAKKKPLIVLFGRANVGKSTLFNNLVEKMQALTSPISGTTRDINESEFSWQGINYNLIDTGGIESLVTKKKLKKLSPRENEKFAVEIIKRTQASIKQAGCVLFLVDAKAGLMPQDRELARQLQQLVKDLGKKTPVILVANKANSKADRARASEFFKLGLGEPFLISGLTGMGVGDLLDHIGNILKMKKTSRAPEPKKEVVKVTLLGKPNVGKSSILNSIFGHERVIVSDIPHTTREPNDIDIDYQGSLYTLIDTAGIRRKANVEKGLEKMSVSKSIESLKKSNVCLLVLDISKPITAQDKTLSTLIIESGVSLIIVANKWDTVEEKDFKEYTLKINRAFPFLLWAPIIFVSAKKNIRTKKLLPLAKELYEARSTKIPDNALSKFLKQAIKGHHPQSYSGERKTPYLQTLKQVATNPPLFELKLKKGDSLQPNYVTYLEKRIREKYNIKGSPITIKVR